MDNTQKLARITNFILELSKRSNYYWSEGPIYSHTDCENDGQIKCANRLIILLEELNNEKN